MEREKADKADALSAGSGGSADVTFMVDTSGSMSGDPICEARNSINEFLRQLEGSDSLVSILNFADRSSWECYCERSNNKRVVADAISALKVDSKNGIGNCSVPLGEFEKKHAKEKVEGKIIVLLTDGSWTHQSSEVKHAQSLKAKGVKIYAVGIGEADYNFLSQVASDGGASKIDLSQLCDTFTQIASNIATQL